MHCIASYSNDPRANLSNQRDFNDFNDFNDGLNELIMN